MCIFMPGCPESVYDERLNTLSAGLRLAGQNPRTGFNLGHDPIASVPGIVEVQPVCTQAPIRPLSAEH